MMYPQAYLTQQHIIVFRTYLKHAILFKAHILLARLIVLSKFMLSFEAHLNIRGIHYDRFTIQGI